MKRCCATFSRAQHDREHLGDETGSFDSGASLPGLSQTCSLAWCKCFRRQTSSSPQSVFPGAIQEALISRERTTNSLVASVLKSLSIRGDRQLATAKLDTFSCVEGRSGELKMIRNFTKQL